MCVNVARLGLGNEDCCGGGDGAGVGGGMMGMYSVVGGGEEAMIAFSQRVEGTWRKYSGCRLLQYRRGVQGVIDEIRDTAGMDGGGTGSSLAVTNAERERLISAAKAVYMTQRTSGWSV